MAHPDTRRSNMPMIDAAKRFAHRAGPWVRGPELVFGATLLIAFVAMAAGTKMLASDLVLPAASTLFFILAGLVALIAACGGCTAELVPRTRSSRIPRREFDRELRVQRGTRIIELLVVLDSEVRKRGCRRNDANFGIGPLVRRNRAKRGEGG
jgi:hypothetical protein